MKTVNTGDADVLLRWREDVRRQRTIFDAFYDQYDAMIGLLCAAAQVGIEARMEEEYLRHQAWFAANYPQRVQPLIAPYIIACYQSLGADPFEELYLSASIEAMLESDEGSIIERMMQMLDALEAWEADIARQEKALMNSLEFR